MIATGILTSNTRWSIPTMGTAYEDEEHAVNDFIAKANGATISLLGWEKLQCKLDTYGVCLGRGNECLPNV